MNSENLTQEPIVDIVIPYWNQIGLTKQCVRSIFSYVRVPYKLTLIDNGSDVFDQDFFEMEKSGVRFIRNKENLGFVKAVNQGLKESVAPFVCFMNNDMVATEFCFKRMLAHLEAHPEVGAVGPCSNFVMWKQAAQLAGDTGKLTPEEINKAAQENYEKCEGQLIDTKLLIGICVLMRREVLEDVGLLDEAFGIGCSDDFDYSIRMRKAGWRLGVARDVFIYHYGHQTFGELKKDPKFDFDKQLTGNDAILREIWGDEEVDDLFKEDNSLGFCLIVKDEEKTLPRCLENLRKVADEIVIVDTGSTDRTKEVAREYTDKVFDYPWGDDFAAARNYSFAKAESGWCVLPETFIVSNKGGELIKNIEFGDRVLTHKGKFSEVTNVFTRNYEGDLIDIKISGSADRLRITPEHRLLVKKNPGCKFRVAKCFEGCVRQYGEKNGKNLRNCKQLYKNTTLKWIEASKLEINDAIVFPKVLSDLKTLFLDDLFPSCKHIELNEEIMRMFGLYIAEGHIGYDYRKKERVPCMLKFSFHEKETDLISHCQNVLWKYFGKKSALKYAKNNKGVVLYCCSRNLARLFPILFGANSETKKFPPKFLDLNSNLMFALFRGIQEGDGTIHPDSFQITTISKGLVYLLKMGLQKCGINATYTTYNKNRRKTHIAYHFRVGGESLESCLFYDLKHPFTESRKNTYSDSWQDENYFYMPVKNIEKYPYRGKLYNLEIRGDNSYVAEGISVHNCMWLDADDYVQKEQAEAIKNLTQNSNGTTAFAFQTHCLRDTGELLLMNTRIRLVKNGRSYRFRNRLHETLDLRGDEFQKVNLPIIHGGPEIAKFKDKDEQFEFNLRILLKEIEEKPEDLFVNFNLARAYKGAGQIEDAKTRYELVMTLDKFKSNFRYLAALGLAELYLDEKEYDEAIDYGYEAIKCTNLRAEPLAMIGLAYFYKKVYHKAAAAFENALQLKPQFDTFIPLDLGVYNYKSWVNLGSCLFHLGQLDKAEECYEKALNYDPLLEDARRNLAIVRDAKQNQNQNLRLIRPNSEEVREHGNRS